MNRKSRFLSKNDIDLTSLLDVIFIILMIVLCNQQINMQLKEDDAKTYMAEAQAAMEEAENMKQQAVSMQDEASEYLSEKALYEEQLKAFSDLENSVTMVTVYADYLPSDIKTRFLRVMAGDTELEKTTVTPQNEKESFALLKEKLTEIASENSEKPVVITLSTEKILYRDEESLNELLTGLCGEFANVYLKEAAK